MAKLDPVNLPEILDSRDERAALQRTLISRFQVPLLCLLVNMPGPVKQNETSRLIHGAGCQAILSMLKQNGLPCIYQETRDLKTGPEGYFLIDSDLAQLKVLACQLEDGHPWGRLFDLDAIGQDFMPLSREALGLERRRCLICGQDGAVCSRSQKHSLAELLQKIERIVHSAGGSEDG
jgi:holo-ACP synthase